jgi:hypothetical protein
VSPLPLEVQTYIEVQTTEIIIRRELRLAVAVTMDDGTHSCKPARIVPHDTEATCTIKRDVAEREIAETTRLTLP